jgi:pSer/pThr/pTyr-binding forkhead associated (FHA) protein
VPELILSLNERELERFAIDATRTTIGRDPSCDVVIDNAGISRLHAAIEIVGDSFVLRDENSENGITLNGEPCREGRLAHGDIIGLNKFLLSFSNAALEPPTRLRPKQEKPESQKLHDVQRTMHVDPEAAQALLERAKEQIARQRADGALPAEEAKTPASSSERARAREPLRWEEPESSGPSLALLVGGMVLGGALIAGLLLILL